jgi:AGCS family alanine or glycine:cation symporter
MGNLVQMKAAADALSKTFSFPPLLFGIFSAVICAFLLFGGYEKLSRATGIIIPCLSLVYLVMSVRVIWIEADQIYPLCRTICARAFSFSSASGGILGFLFSHSLRQGIAKGSFSHEAGCGTAPMAHASADTDSAVRQGFFGIIEVMCDTLLLCTLTAYTVLLSETALIGSSTEVAINAFSASLGEPVKILLGLSIFLFALGSVASWSFYGQESIRALGLGKKSIKIYGAFFAFSAFLGCIIPEGIVWQLADLSISAMALINIVAVLLLSETVIKLTKSFCKKDRGSKTI